VSKKSPKIALLIAEISVDAKDNRFDPHYLAYFECFNRQMYYEAHDVLEELWLETKGRHHYFYKGLIQLAGAFVHLKKSKLNPGARLFRLALKYLNPYVPVAEGLDVTELVARIQDWLLQLENSNHTRNPYDPDCPPALKLKSKGHAA